MEQAAFGRVVLLTIALRRSMRQLLSSPRRNSRNLLNSLCQHRCRLFSSLPSRILPPHHHPRLRAAFGLQRRRLPPRGRMAISSRNNSKRNRRRSLRRLPLCSLHSRQSLTMCGHSQRRGIRCGRLRVGATTVVVAQLLQRRRRPLPTTQEASGRRLTPRPLGRRRPQLLRPRQRRDRP